MENSFVKALTTTKEEVWSRIEEYLKSNSTLPDYCLIKDKYQNIKDFHYSLVNNYPKRKGKYFRPTLLVLTAQALNVPKEKYLNTAAAMQISEDWILNHDDIEDDSLERRGSPALHRQFTKELAINAGDGLQTLMWRVINDNYEKLPLKTAKEIADEFYWMLDRTILGQTIEIKWLQDNRLDLSDEDILLILESKTGYYTIGGPMRLGGILGGLKKQELDKLYEFGKLMGYCFQIKDDLLDLTSDFAGLKNQVGNDIYEGKRTIMLGHLIRNINEKEKLVEILNKSREEKSETEVKWIINKMAEYGSLEYGQKMMEKYAKEATTYFDKELKFLPECTAKSELRSGIEFVINRDH